MIYLRGLVDAPSDIPAEGLLPVVRTCVLIRIAPVVLYRGLRYSRILMRHHGRSRAAYLRVLPQELLQIISRNRGFCFTVPCSMCSRQALFGSYVVGFDS